MLMHGIATRNIQTSRGKIVQQIRLKLQYKSSTNSHILRTSDILTVKGAHESTHKASSITIPAQNVSLASANAKW